MSRKMYNRSQLIIAALLVLTLVFSQAGIAYASVSAQEFCEDNNGSWSGANAHTGTCTYPVGNAVAVVACGQNHIYTVIWVVNFEDSTSCTYVEPASEPDPQPPYGDCGDLQEGQVDDSTSLTPCYSDGQSYVNFGPGACSGSCRTSSSLPKDAANHLPGDALDTLYVMVRDADGNPSSDSYTVCFANASGAQLTIYRFVSGAWSALVTSSGDPICATATGDGAFYLGSAD